jgi:transposase
MKSRKEKNMRQFKIPNRDQTYLFMNVNLHSIAPIGSSLRCIDELVDKLDISEIEKDYDFESAHGREPFHPKTLIKVALYAMHNCRFSLRKIEYDTEYNLGYKWLTGGEIIDHSTEGKFLSKHKDELVNLFEQVVVIGAENELVDFELLGVDTIKIRANASYKQFRDKEGIKKEREKIRKRLEEIMDKAASEQDELEKEECRILEARDSRLKEAKKELERREKERKITAEKKQKVRINMTDFDCKLAQQANGETNAGYAITSTTDSKNDFITGFEINENNSDSEMLLSVLETSKDNCCGKHEVVVADSGFSSIDNLGELKEEGQKALIPDRRVEVEGREETSKGEYDRSNFKYDEKNDIYRCPNGAILEKTGEVKLSGREYNQYKNADACAVCEVREKCTKGKYRIISRDKEEHLKEEMREELSKKRNQKLYNQRGHMTESPYGQIKHNLKYRIFMRRGFGKIKMEIALLFMLHNMLKIGQATYT